MTEFAKWPNRHVWQSEQILRYRQLAHALRIERDRIYPLDDPLLLCLNSGRAFCFLRTVTRIERVALRDQWENTRIPE